MVPNNAIHIERLVLLAKDHSNLDEHYIKKMIKKRYKPYKNTEYYNFDDGENIVNYIKKLKPPKKKKKDESDKVDYLFNKTLALKDVNLFVKYNHTLEDRKKVCSKVLSRLHMGEAEILEYIKQELEHVFFSNYDSC